MNRHWLNINTDRPNCYSVCSLYFVTKTDTFKSLKLLLWAVICFILSFSVVPALLPLLGCPGRQKASSLSDFSQTLPIFHRWPSSTSKRIDPLEIRNPSFVFYYNFWQECAFQRSNLKLWRMWWYREWYRVIQSDMQILPGKDLQQRGSLSREWK